MTSTAAGLKKQKNSGSLIIDFQNRSEVSSPLFKADSVILSTQPYTFYQPPVLRFN